MKDFKIYMVKELSCVVCFYMVIILVNYLVEIEDWDNEEVWVIVGEWEDFNILICGIYYFVEGWQVYCQGNKIVLVQVIEMMVQECKDVVNQVIVSGVFMCSVVGFSWFLFNQLDIDQVWVMVLELEVM